MVGQALVAAPAASGAQVPAPFTLHALQAPQLELLQQTPSVHIVLRHSLPALQAAPSAFRFVQTPDWQLYPLTQSPLAVQPVRQVVPPHIRWPGQGCGVCTQTPAPSQLPAGVLVAPVQVAAPQLVPALVARQAPAPLHVPSNPQGGAAVHRWCGSAAPDGTGWHEPALPVRLQTWQVPQLADEQQTPSTQCALSHSASAVQIWPRRLRPQEPSALQNWPGAQSALLAQTETQVWVVALQVNGKHFCAAPTWHFPAPSQVAASVPVVEPAGQLGGAHCVPAV